MIVYVIHTLDSLAVIKKAAYRRTVIVSERIYEWKFRSNVMRHDMLLM